MKTPHVRSTRAYRSASSRSPVALVPLPRRQNDRFPFERAGTWWCAADRAPAQDSQKGA